MFERERRRLAICRAVALALPVIVLVVVIARLLFRVEYWATYTMDSVQAAVERAGSRYHARTGKRPTHVWLPEDARRLALRLWDLVPIYDGRQGVVKVGRLD